MTDAYTTGIAIHDDLRDGGSLSAAVSDAVMRTETLDDAYPNWHPAPDSFRGMLRLFIYREITGDSYRTIAQYQELADAFGLEHIPDESVLSRTWRNRFDDAVREFVTLAAHFVVKEVYDHGPIISTVRQKEEVLDEKDESTVDSEDDATDGREFTNEQVHQTTRLAREHGFDGFDSRRISRLSTRRLSNADRSSTGSSRRIPVSRDARVPSHSQLMGRSVRRTFLSMG